MKAIQKTLGSKPTAEQSFVIDVINYVTDNEKKYKVLHAELLKSIGKYETYEEWPVTLWNKIYNKLKANKFVPANWDKKVFQKWELEEMKEDGYTFINLNVPAKKSCWKLKVGQKAFYKNSDIPNSKKRPVKLIHVEKEIGGYPGRLAFFQFLDTDVPTHIFVDALTQGEDII